MRPPRRFPPPWSVDHFDFLTGEVLSVPAMAAAPPWACAREQRGAAAVALGFSKVFLRRRTPAWRCHAPSGLDRRRVGRRFAAALRDSVSSVATAPGRARG